MLHLALHQALHPVHIHIYLHGNEGDEGVEQSQLEGLSTFDKDKMRTSYRD